MSSPTTDDYKEMMQPQTITCAQCGCKAYVFPFIDPPKGLCVCPNCTFGDASLTMSDVLLRLFNK